MKFFIFSSVFLVLSTAVDTTETLRATDIENKTFKGNILNFMLVTAPSHHAWNARLMRALAEEGYNVTSVSFHADKEPTKNLHYIHLEKGYEVIEKALQESKVNISKSYLTEPEENIRLYYGWSFWNCKAAFASNGFQTLLNYPDNMKFDLVIYETTIGPCLLPFLDKFPKAPLMTTVPFVIAPYAFYLTGTPNFPSFLPHYVYPYPTQNLLGRMYNLYLYVVEIYIRKSMIAKLDKIARKYFGPDMKYLGSYEDRSEIFLVNTHPSMQQAQPLMPNLIQVGGLQIKNNSSLSNDIEHFISSSINGAVLFSLGTNIKTETLGEKRLQMIMNVIRRLPQYNFLWKLDLPSQPSLPKNLMVKNFMPQNDILAHPKIKLFLSHTGLLSAQEAVWHAVPVLAMPFFVDQPMNAYRLVQDGVAEQLNFFTFNEEELYETITKMLNDPGYSFRMKHVSSLFRNRPQPPLDLALYWCKYLISNGDAKHLRSPAMEMSHFVLHMWDVLLVFLGVILSTALLLIKLVHVGLVNKMINVVFVKIWKISKVKTK